MNLDSTNPYVGLRPYEAEESLLFFGRAEQTLELLQRLHQHHFVAVVGSSGCGKSSLLRAGLIPALKAGYLVEDSDQWFVGIMKPGQSPLYNLAETLLQQLSPNATASAVTELVPKIKEEGVDAILDIIKHLKKDENLNFFLLVDQFEELFRFTMEQTDLEKRDDAIDFVNIMLELSTQTLVPFYVVMTMRSDFIGDCSQFFGLPEAMNKSMYLVPSMSRQQLKKVIESPAKLFGGKLNPALTTRLLNELGKVKDELPLLQHALMRMWEFEMDVDKNGELDLQDYKEIGGIEKALSKHADEALDGMSAEDLLLTKHIFQALTSIDENGRKVRRPVLLSHLKELTGKQEEKLLYIVNRFIEEKRSFLMVNNAGANDKVIDISHESLIRQWATLSEWVDEENESVSIYLQLNEAARLNKLGKKDFLTGSELQLAMDWHDEFKPAAAWANRYKAGFEDAIQYLKASENERSRIQSIEKTRKKKQRNLIISLIAVLSLAAVGSGIASFYFSELNKTATEQKLLAEAKTEEALLSEKKADSLAKIANDQREIAEAKANEALLSEKKADSSARVAYTQRLLAETKTEEALASKQRANSSAKIALEQREIAEQETLNAEKQTKLANIEKNKALANYLISEANRQVDKDPTLALRLAEKAIQTNNNEIIHRDALKIYNDNNFYKIIANDTSSILSVAFSPDGSTILTGSDDKTARLWNLQGEILQEFTGHTNYITSVAFSPNGQSIVTGSYDQTARLWNLQGEMLQEFTGHTNYICSVAFSPNGQSILTGSCDQTAHLWDLKGEILQEFTGHTARITSVAFSPDGKTILTGSDDETARLWNLQGEILQEFIGHTDRITSVGFPPGGKTIVTGSEDKTARLWNLQGEMLEEFTGHRGSISSVAFSPDGKTILTGSEDKTARLWNLQGEMLEEFTVHRGSIFSVAFSPDGKTILTGSEDKTARLWMLKEKLIQEISGQSGAIYSLAFSPSGKTILLGTETNIRLWNLTGGTILEFPYASSIYSVAFSPTGDTILTGSENNHAHFWNIEGEMIQVLPSPGSDIYSVAFSPDGKTMLIGSLNNPAQLWNLKGKVVLEYNGHSDDVFSGTFSPDGNTILTGSKDNTAQLWNLKGEMIQKYTGHSDDVNSVAFSPDGNTILTGSRDNSARLWDLKGEMLQEFTGHTEAIYSVSFSPDGRTILTGSQDNSARLWNLKGVTIEEFKGPNSKIECAAYSPNGKTILTGSWDGTANLWKVPMPLEEFLKSGLLEPLSAEQKEKYGVAE